MLAAVGWPANKMRTDRNRYASDPFTVTCIVLCHLCSPARGNDMKLLLERHTSQLSELFREGIETFLETRKHLLIDDISSTFILTNAGKFAKAVYEETHALDN